jgi:putative tryptophan/tyrosine transport system substrate-binding protein
MTRRRIGLLLTLALGLLAVPLPTAAPPPKKVPTLGVFLPRSPPTAPDWKQRSVLLQELRSLGWIEGENLHVEYRWASGQLDRGADLAADLVGLGVDVIVVDNSALIRAIQRATTTIPVVMLSVDDPVAEGFIAGLAQPGGNITGVDNSFVPALDAKLLEILKEAVPVVTRIGVLTRTGFPSYGQILEDIQGAARGLGVQLHVLPIAAPHDLEPAFEAASREGAGALLILAALFFALRQEQLAALASRHRLPAIFWQGSFARVGGLLAYGPNASEGGRRAAYYVDRILKGAKPADLPVERPTSFELVINLKTAQTLGLTMPPSLLFQATEVIR